MPFGLASVSLKAKKYFVNKQYKNLRALITAFVLLGAFSYMVGRLVNFSKKNKLLVGCVPNSDAAAYETPDSPGVPCTLTPSIGQCNQKNNCTYMSVSLCEVLYSSNSSSHARSKI